MSGSIPTDKPVDRPLGPTGDLALCEAFLEMLSAERGASLNTLHAYRRDLDDFRARTGSLAAAGAAEVRAYLSELAGRGFAPTSQARRLSALRQFFRFLVAEGLRTDDPTGVVDRPKSGRPLPKVLSIADVDRLLAAAHGEAQASESTQPRRVAALRVCALLELLYATGLRVSELVSLPASAGRGGRPLIAVRGKGGRERLVPLNVAAQAALDAYREARDMPGRDPGKWL